MISDPVYTTKWVLDSNAKSVMDDTAEAADRVKSKLEALAGVNVNVGGSGGAGVIGQISNDAEKLTGSLGNLSSAGGGASGILGDLAANSMAFAAGVAVLLIGVAALAEGVRKGSEALAEFIGQGVEFDARLESGRLSLAAITLTFEDYHDRLGNIVPQSKAFALATDDAATTQDRLRAISFQTGEGMGVLEQSYRRVALAAGLQGASTQELMTLIVTMTKLAIAGGQDIDRVSNQIALAITGMSQARGFIGEALRGQGITPETLRQWAELHTSVQNINKAFSQFAGLQDAASGTLKVIEGRAAALREQLSGITAEPVLKEIEKISTALIDGFAHVESGKLIINPAIKDELVAIGKSSAELIDRMTPLIPIMLGVADAGLRITEGSLKLINFFADLGVEVVKQIPGISLFVEYLKLVMTFTGSGKMTVPTPISFMASHAGDQPLGFASSHETAQDEYFRKLKDPAEVFTPTQKAYAELQAQINKTDAEAKSFYEGTLAGTADRALAAHGKAIADLNIKLEENRVKHLDISAIQEQINAENRKWDGEQYQRIQQSTDAYTNMSSSIATLGGRVESLQPRMEKLLSGGPDLQGQETMSLHVDELIDRYTKLGTQIDRTFKDDPRYTTLINEYNTVGNTLNKLTGLYNDLIDKQEHPIAGVVANANAQVAAEEAVTDAVKKHYDVMATAEDKFNNDFITGLGTRTQAQADLWQQWINTDAKKLGEDNALIIGERQKLADYLDKLNKELVDQHSLAAALKAGDLAGAEQYIQELAALTNTDIADMAQKVATQYLPHVRSAQQGIVLGFLEIQSSIHSVGRDIADYMLGVWNTISAGAKSLLFDIATHNWQNFRSDLKKIFDDILKDWLGMLEKSLERWLFNQGIMQETDYLKSGGLPTSTNYSQFVGSGGQGEIGSPNRTTGTGGATFGSSLGGVGAGLGVTGAVAGASGAPGFSTGATIGGLIGTAGAAYETILFGAASTFNPYVIAVMAVVAGLIAILAHGNTEMNVYVNAQTQINGQTIKLLEGFNIATTGLSDIAQSILQTRDSIEGSLLDTFGASGLSGKADFATALNKAILAYLEGMNFKVHAGSQDDLAKDLQTLLTQELPKELLGRLFGSNAFSRDLPGISGGTGFNVDNTGPLTQFLTQFGFSMDAIKALANRAYGEDTKTFLSELNSIITIVKGFRDAQSSLGQTVSQHFAGFTAAANESPLSSIVDSVTNITALAQELSFYTGAERISHAQQLLQITQQLDQTVTAYLQKIWQTQNALATTGSNIADKMSRYSETSDNVVARDSNVVSLAGYKINQATSPEQIQQYATDAYNAISEIFDLLEKRATDTRSLLVSLTTLQTNLGTIGQSVAAFFPDQSAQGRLLEIQNQIDDAAMESGQEQLNSLSEIRDESQSLYDDLQKFIQSTQDEITKIVSDSFNKTSGWIRQLQSIGALGVSGQGTLASIPLEIANAATPAEVQTAIGRALAAGDDFFNSLKANLDAAKNTLQEIGQNVADLHNSVAKQKESYLLQTLTDPQKAKYYQDQITGLLDQFSSQNSASGVKNLTDQILQYSQAYVGLYGANDPSRKDAYTKQAALLDQLEKLADAAYSRLGVNVQSTVDSTTQAIINLGIKIDNLTSAGVNKLQGMIDKADDIATSLKNSLGPAINSTVSLLNFTDAQLERLAKVDLPSISANITYAFFLMADNVTKAVQPLVGPGGSLANTAALFTDINNALIGPNGTIAQNLTDFKDAVIAATNAVKTVGSGGPGGPPTPTPMYDTRSSSELAFSNQNPRVKFALTGS